MKKYIAPRYEVLTPLWARELPYPVKPRKYRDEEYVLVPIKGKPRRLFRWIAERAYWEGTTYKVMLTGRLYKPNGPKFRKELSWEAKKRVHPESGYTTWEIGDASFVESYLPRNSIHFDEPRGWNRNELERVPGTGIFAEEGKFPVK